MSLTLYSFECLFLPHQPEIKTDIRLFFNYFALFVFIALFALSSVVASYVEDRIRSISNLEQFPAVQGLCLCWCTVPLML